MTILGTVTVTVPVEDAPGLSDGTERFPVSPYSFTVTVIEPFDPLLSQRLYNAYFVLEATAAAEPWLVILSVILNVRIAAVMVARVLETLVVTRSGATATGTPATDAEGAVMKSGDFKKKPVLDKLGRNQSGADCGHAGNGAKFGNIRSAAAYGANNSPGFRVVKAGVFQ